VRDPLFPGALPILLGLAGLALAPRRYAWLAVLGSLVAVVISLGPATPAYRFLHEHVLLFRGLRALARFSIVPVLALSVLLALALAGLRWWRVVALLLLMLEADIAPIGYARYEPPSPAARSLLGGKRRGRAAPLGRGRHGCHARRAGPLPAVAQRRLGLRAPAVHARDGAAQRSLRHGRAAPAAGARRAPAAERAAAGGLPEPERIGDTFVYELPEGEPARVAAPARARAAQWGPRGALVDLGAEEAVGRVLFEPGDGAWIDEPRVELSSDGASWRDVRARASLADATLALYLDPRGAAPSCAFPRSARASYGSTAACRRDPARSGSDR
jgi:hypothetical protein